MNFEVRRTKRFSRLAIGWSRVADEALVEAKWGGVEIIALWAGLRVATETLRDGNKYKILSRHTRQTRQPSAEGIDRTPILGPLEMTESEA